jgi:hypothetical protein
MGTGRDLGRQLGAALQEGTLPADSGRALANRFGDWLGADRSLEGPLRDLASRPRLRQALTSQGLARRRALSDLADELAQTYSPRVLAELLALLEAAFDESALGPVAPAMGPRRPAGPMLRGWAGFLADGLRAIGPGMALAVAAAAVLSWLAGVLARTLPGPWSTSAGLFLASLILLAQGLTLGPLRRWRRRWTLDPVRSDQPRLAWLWASSPWIHLRNSEAVLNALALLLILGASPLSLREAVLRYALTALATTAAAALCARRMGLLSPRWQGATGAVSALLALPVVLGLLQRRELTFPLAAIAVPAWVPFLVVGALQLRWILPRQREDDDGEPGQRLLASTWWWGLVFGTAWALLTWGRALIDAWLPSGR